MRVDSNGTVTTTRLGPSGTIQYACRNLSMAAFADELRAMLATNLGSNPILDMTGLAGKWNFDLRYTLQIALPSMGDSSDRISIFDAIDKQLGLKLEQQTIPASVIVVDSVNEKPAENPPGVAEALPPAPTEFEVASVKPSDPGPPMMMNMRTLPGGRLTAQGMSLGLLVRQAFGSNSEYVTGLPKWADTARFDIDAKVSTEDPSAAPIDTDARAPLLLALLVDRFHLRYHTEEQPVTAYTLVSAKPKMKPADPASRTNCKNSPPPASAPGGSRMFTCQNVTMAQFAERLQGMTSELVWPLQDATGLEGAWDFSLTYDPFPAAVRALASRGGGGDAGERASEPPTAAEPSGGYTLFEAIEKQLGLKLEPHKRPMPVIVIDHIEEKPTEN
jgi:uncharacterized protein (TIGR03435 family)